MHARVVSLLFCSQHAQFESQFSLEESITRLQEACCQGTTHAAHFKPQCRITRRRVELQYSSSWIDSSESTRFVGAFEPRSTALILNGRFTIGLFAQTFVAVWLALFVPIALVSIAALILRLPSEPEESLTGLFGVALIGAGAYFILWMKKRRFRSEMRALAIFLTATLNRAA